MPQAIPPGLELTVPVPVPAVATVNNWGGTTTVKVAVADFAASMVNWQVAEAPAQAPLQPEKMEPEAAAAVSVTTVL